MLKVTFVLSLLLCSGCATIMHGTYQYVEIKSQPAAATAFVNGEAVITPAKVLLKRGFPTQEYQVLLEKDGYKPGYAKINQKLSGWLWGDIIWGILPGIAVDALSGAAFDLYPKQVMVNLEESAK